METNKWQRKEEYVSRCYCVICELLYKIHLILWIFVWHFCPTCFRPLLKLKLKAYISLRPNMLNKSMGKVYIASYLDVYRDVRFGFIILQIKDVQGLSSSKTALEFVWARFQKKRKKAVVRWNFFNDLLTFPPRL